MAKFKKLKLVVGRRPQEIKTWQDCQWKRNACGRDDCPICGPIKQEILDFVVEV